MNFRLKSWDVFSWTAMRGGFSNPADNRVYILQGEGSDRDRKVSLVPIGIDFSTEG